MTTLWLKHTDRNSCEQMTVGGELKLTGSLAGQLQVKKPNMTSVVYIVYDIRFCQTG